MILETKYQRDSQDRGSVSTKRIDWKLKNPGGSKRNAPDFVTENFETQTN